MGAFACVCIGNLGGAGAIQSDPALQRKPSPDWEAFQSQWGAFLSGGVQLPFGLADAEVGHPINTVQLPLSYVATQG